MLIEVLYLARKKLPKEAREWLKVFRLQFQDVHEKRLDEEIKDQIDRHGLLDYLLVARNHPALIVAGFKELSNFLKKAEKTDDMKWLLEEGRHPVREAVSVYRNHIFADVFRRINSLGK